MQPENLVDANRPELLEGKWRAIAAARGQIQIDAMLGAEALQPLHAARE